MCASNRPAPLPNSRFCSSRLAATHAIGRAPWSCRTHRLLLQEGMRWPMWCGWRNSQINLNTIMHSSSIPQFLLHRSPVSFSTTNLGIWNHNDISVEGHANTWKHPKYWKQNDENHEIRSKLIWFCTFTWFSSLFHIMVMSFSYVLSFFAHMLFPNSWNSRI